MEWQFIAQTKDELVKKLTSGSYNSIESGVLTQEQILEWKLLKERFYINFDNIWPYYIMWGVVSSTELLADITERDLTNQPLGVRFKAGCTTTFIACFLLREDGGKWGYRRLKEDDNPCYWNCPPHLLEKAPVTCQKWRDRVHADAKHKAYLAFPGKALARLLLDITEQPFRSEELMDEMAEQIARYLIRLGWKADVSTMLFDKGLLPEDDSAPFAWALESATGGLSMREIATKVKGQAWRRFDEILQEGYDILYRRKAA